METVKKQNLQKHSFRIGGMFCVHCQNTIEKELKNTAGIHKAAVNYNTGAATLTYDAEIIGFDKISSIIEELGYQVLEGEKKAVLSNKKVLQIIWTLAIILALFILMRVFINSKLAAAFPIAKEGMGYGMLLVIGLLTSVHCIAMCGGINLSQTLLGTGDLGLGDREKRKENSEWGKNDGAASTSALLLPSLLYNGGRLVSYTAIGVFVGALGSVITLSGRFQGVLHLIAGIFMVIMGLNMLGLFPVLRRLSPRMPKFFAEKMSGRGPLLVGFLNGFMPCGPLQAMQIYALSTGSPVKGGIAMFLFCAGTIPLMFALGAASSALSGIKGRAFSSRIMRTGSILVAAMGLVMFSNGFSLSKFTNPLDRVIPFKPASTQAGGDASGISQAVQNSVQIINSALQPNRYPAITVQQGTPVRWIINAPSGSITGCNSRVIIREYGIQHTFKQGDNVIEFTPEKTGRFRYSCWMGMINSTITVLAEG